MRACTIVPMCVCVRTRVRDVCVCVFVLACMHACELKELNKAFRSHRSLFTCGGDPSFCNSSKRQ